jgi:cytosine/adenosine deaminase-related metal-dependent hydrolase
MKRTLYVESLINPGEEPLQGVRISIENGVITRVEEEVLPNREDVSLPGKVCSPALFNSHDHLKYTWPEHLGEGRYANSYEWLPTLYREAEQKFLSRLALEDLYWLGTYKNLFAGVTTVANHCRPLPQSFFDQFPIRILHRFRREIFVREDARAHKMGLGAAEEAFIAKRERMPLVVHIAEGVDRLTEEEVDVLDGLNGLFEGCVLVHAININQDQIRKIASAGSSVVWCPVSNRFLFGRTAPIQSLLTMGVNIALGTDSTCTGAEDLRREMEAASEELAGFPDSSRLLHEFCTINGARAFGLANLGRVAPGYSADLLAFEQSTDDPFDDLMRTGAEKFVFLMKDGQLLFRRCEVEMPFDNVLPEVSVVRIDDADFEVVGYPEQVLSRVARLTDQPREAFPLGRMINVNRCALA